VLRSLGYDVGIGDKLAGDSGFGLVLLVAFRGAGTLSGFDQDRVIRER
jgi:hypothetical protein